MFGTGTGVALFWHCYFTGCAGLKGFESGLFTLARTSFLPKKIVRQSCREGNETVEKPTTILSVSWFRRNLKYFKTVVVLLLHSSAKKENGNSIFNKLSGLFFGFFWLHHAAWSLFPAQRLNPSAQQSTLGHEEIPLPRLFYRQEIVIDCKKLIIRSGQEMLHNSTRIKQNPHRVKRVETSTPDFQVLLCGVITAGVCLAPLLRLFHSFLRNNPRELWAVLSPFFRWGRLRHLLVQ